MKLSIKQEQSNPGTFRKRDCPVQLRLSQEEHDKLMTLTNKQSIPFSVYIRSKIFDHNDGLELEVTIKDQKVTLSREECILVHKQLTSFLIGD